LTTLEGVIDRLEQVDAAREQVHSRDGVPRAGGDRGRVVVFKDIAGNRWDLLGR
jgi:hypothetical protein